MAQNTFIKKVVITVPGGAMSSSTSIESGARVGVNAEAIASDAINAPVNIGFPYARLKMIAMKASENMTLKFNSSGSPVPSISLVKDRIYEWDTASPTANPFTADVTIVYVTNLSSPAAAATLDIECLYDPTA